MLLDEEDEEEEDEEGKVVISNEIADVVRASTIQK